MKERSKAVQVIQRIDHRVTRIFDAFSLISTIALIAVMLMAVVDVVGSKVFHTPFAPAYELTQMFSIPLVFFTVGVVQMGRGMMRIDLLANQFPKWLQRALNLISSVLGAVFCVFLAWRAWVYAYGTLYLNHIKTTGNVKLAMWPFGMMLVFGLIMLAAAFVFSTLRAALNYEVLPDLSPDELLAGEGQTRENSKGKEAEPDE